MSPVDINCVPGYPIAVNTAAAVIGAAYVVIVATLCIAALPARASGYEMMDLVAGYAMNSRRWGILFPKVAVRRSPPTSIALATF